MAHVTVASNAVIGKLYGPNKAAPDPAVVTYVNNLLSFKVDGAGFGGLGWDGRSSFFDVTNNTFPAGFAHLVSTELASIGHTVGVVKKPLPSPLGPENPIVDEFGNDNPDYDYQLKALRQVEKYGAGVIQVATGGGKSKIAKLIMARYRRMTLFLTTRGILMYQMDDQLKAIGLNTGQIGDGEMRVTKGVNLGMVQTLVSALQVPKLSDERIAVITALHKSRKRDQGKNPTSDAEITRIAQERYDEKVKKRNQIIKILEMVEVVIGEEAHEAGGNSYYEILRHCKNAAIRVALTATPFMRTSAEDNMRLMAAFGPTLIQISEKMLIDRGILAKPYFIFRDVAPHPKLYKTSPFERAYTLGYLENEAMYEQALADALKGKELGMPTLSLILRKKHGEEIERRYKAAGLRVEFLKGENDQAERKEQLRRLAAGEIDVCIGTTILDVGVDCPAIGLLQLLGGGKAEVALRQRIGRALRRKKGKLNASLIIDYTCNKNGSLSEHARQRRLIIESTPGFVEGIVQDSENFDWTMFA